MRQLAGPTALAFALILPASAPSAARAQEDNTPRDRPLVVQIAGPCVMGLDGHKAGCNGVAYMAFPSSGRIDFTVLRSGMSVAFSGETDENEDGSYTLTLDSVVSPQSGRMEAEGQCEMNVEKDGRTVRDIACEAETEAGTLTLEASGVMAAADIGDADKMDDGIEDDSAQG